METNTNTDKTNEPIVISEVKLKSIGWLLGRSLVFAHKVIKALVDNPEHAELVEEGRWLLRRWEVERRIK